MNQPMSQLSPASGSTGDLVIVVPGDGQHVNPSFTASGTADWNLSQQVTGILQQFQNGAVVQSFPNGGPIQAAVNNSDMWSMNFTNAPNGTWTLLVASVQTAGLSASITVIIP